MKYIEEFWQEPRFEDLAAAAEGKPLLARYHLSNEPVTITGLLVGYHAGLNPWILAVGADESLRYKKKIQVYRLPAPPDGYELIDTSKAKPQDGDICYHDNKWCIEFALGDTTGFLANTLYARKITPTPYEGCELIDTKTATPSCDDLFWNRETKAWCTRVAGAVVSFIPGVFYCRKIVPTPPDGYELINTKTATPQEGDLFWNEKAQTWSNRAYSNHPFDTRDIYCRKKQPALREYTWEEAGELLGRQLYIDNGSSKHRLIVNKITKKNDGRILVNDYYQSHLIKYATILPECYANGVAKPVPFGKKVEG